MRGVEEPKLTLLGHDGVLPIFVDPFGRFYSVNGRGLEEIGAQYVGFNLPVPIEDARNFGRPVGY